MPETRHALVVIKKQIESDLLGLFTAAADAMGQAMSCLTSGDKVLCRHIIEHDAEINRGRHLVETECLTAIALHQLVANDLQDVVAATRIAGDLERRGRSTPTFEYGLYRSDGLRCTRVHCRVAIRPRGYRKTG